MKKVGRDQTSTILLVFFLFILLATHLLSGCTVGNINVSGNDVARRGNETGTHKVNNVNQKVDYKKVLATADKWKTKPVKITRKEIDAYKRGLEFAKKNRQTIIQYYYHHYASGVLRKHDRFLSANPKAEGAKEEVLALFATTWEITGGSFLAYECLRSKERQAKLLKEKKTKTLNSRHLSGQACDFCPWSELEPGKLEWGNKQKYSFIHGVNAGVWEIVSLENKFSGQYRSGMDWDGDGKFKDQTFNDLAHGAIHFDGKGYNKIKTRLIHIYQDKKGSSFDIKRGSKKTTSYGWDNLSLDKVRDT